MASQETRSFELEQMYKIVVSTMSRTECEPFNAPVDWKGLHLNDYPAIVKEPRDLGTIKANMEAGGYANIDECVGDVRLVWSNCMLYNRDGSDFYHLADTFSRAFEDAYAAIRKLSSSNQDLNRVPAVAERIALSYDIFKINNIEMARALTIIESESPNALVKKQDEVIINFDSITPNCFHTVNAFVSTCMIESGGNSKAKKRPAGGGSWGPQDGKKSKK